MSKIYILALLTLFFSFHGHVLLSESFEYTIRSISELHSAIKSKQYDALLVLFEEKDQVKTNFTGIKSLEFGRVWYPKKYKHSRFLQQLNLPSLVWFDGQTEIWETISELTDEQFTAFIYQKAAQFTRWTSKGNLVYLNSFTFYLYTKTSPRDLIVSLCESLDRDCNKIRDVIKDLAWEMEHQNDFIFAIMNAEDSNLMLTSLNIQRQDAVLVFSKCYQYGYGIIENSFPIEEYPFTLHNFRLFVNAMLSSTVSDLDVAPDTYLSIQNNENVQLSSKTTTDSLPIEEEEEEEEEEDNENSIVKILSQSFEFLEQTRCVFGKYCRDFAKFPMKYTLFERIQNLLPLEIDGIQETFAFVKENILEHGLQYVSKKESELGQCVHPKYKKEKQRMDKVIKLFQKVFGKKLCLVNPPEASHSSPYFSHVSPIFPSNEPPPSLKPNTDQPRN
ncbi:hypothetical protein HMI54_008388 [Coelomomyces lativittatus]|nr:hypothetical protein HMI54_008388 [Coelomomyces lativittatus]